MLKPILKSIRLVKKFEHLIVYYHMKTFSINTLGCKVNQYESQQIRQLLEGFGLEQTPVDQSPDLAIVNTCCVTKTASAKSRQSIHKARRLNPQTPVIVAGCLAAIRTDELEKPGKNIHIVRHRDDLAATLNLIVLKGGNGSESANLQNYIKSKNASKIKSKNGLSKPPIFSELTSFKGHTRAFLKTQDGCDGCCSYCIIPRARPVVWSKPAGTVLKEAQALVAAGHKEIVLTGIFLGAYGQSTVRRKKWPAAANDKLVELLEKLARLPSLSRIRLSSLEPADITERLLDTFCTYPNIMPHLHLSVQSASDRVLKRMCRQYGAEDLIEKTQLIKSRLERPAITGDFIVGFPGESDSDFCRTVEFARQVGFAKMHVFSFSSREGTSAALMQTSVNNEVMKQRCRQLQDLGVELAGLFREQFVGESAEVLIEDTADGAIGRSERYFSVRVKKKNCSIRKNDLVKVKLIENSRDHIVGEFSCLKDVIP